MAIIHFRNENPTKLVHLKIVTCAAREIDLWVRFDTSRVLMGSLYPKATLFPLFIEIGRFEGKPVAKNRPRYDKNLDGLLW
jgi:hypothetical protein